MSLFFISELQEQSLVITKLESLVWIIPAIRTLNTSTTEKWSGPSMYEPFQSAANKRMGYIRTSISKF